jgi:hypothetical protein
MVAVNGITVTRSDNMYRSLMNATKGFAIQKNIGTTQNPNWVDQFWADLDGTIIANSIQIRNSFVLDSSITLGRHPNIIRLDPYGGGFWAGDIDPSLAPAHIAMDGTATFSKLIVKDKNNKLLIDAANGYVDFGLMDIIGVGAISAELLSASFVAANYGYISDLTAERLSTLSRAAIQGWTNYLTAESNAVKFISGRVSGAGTQEKLPDGRLLYWVNSSQTGLMTTEETSWPVMKYPMEEKLKMILSFSGQGDEAFPRIYMGLGDGVVKDPAYNDGQNTENSTNKSARAFISKPAGSFDIEYFTTNYAKERSLIFRDTGIYIKSEQNVLNTLAKIYQLGIEENGELTIQHANGAKIYIDVNGKIKIEAFNGIDIIANGTVNISGSSYNFA